MFLSTKQGVDEVYELFDKIGIKEACENANTAIIKINLARAPVKNHPRTSSELIAMVVKYLYIHNVKCAIAESADGYLEQNINEIGLEELVRDNEVELIDLDLEEVEEVLTGDEIHYIPKCFNQYDLRIAIPLTSKRPNAIYSNNVKLFVGAVPRKFYQIGDLVTCRPGIHIDLHKSVSNIYSAIENYSPFDFFVNGGLAMDEVRGEFIIPEILVGNDGPELDWYILEKYFVVEPPDYLIRFK